MDHPHDNHGDQQQGACSTGSHRTVEYEIHLYSISNFVDIGKILTVISKRSSVTHDLEDKDTCTVSNIERMATDL